MANNKTEYIDQKGIKNNTIALICESSFKLYFEVFIVLVITLLALVKTCHGTPVVYSVATFTKKVESVKQLKPGLSPIYLPNTYRPCYLRLNCCININKVVSLLLLTHFGFKLTYYMTILRGIPPPPFLPVLEKAYKQDS